MLRLLEHYPSVQGECDRTGILTQFVRFAGCNLRCAKWPCDTPYSIEPKLYRNEQTLVSVDDLVIRIENMANKTGAENICLTGGEPLLQPKGELTLLISLLKQKGYSLEMFSNGTIEYPREMLNSCSIRMDWKLPGSGEDPHNPVRRANFATLQSYDYHTIKFTMSDANDYDTAYELYRDMGTWMGTIYAGSVWNAKLTAAQIVERIISDRLPWRLNYQLHKVVWPADARGT